MERVIKKDRYENVACNDILIYTGDGNCLGENILQDLNDDWKIIKPRYYIYKDDNTILEIWYNNRGILLNGSIKGFINDYWISELREEITYAEAMYILDKEQENKEPGFDITKSIEESMGNLYGELGIDSVKDDNIDAMAFCFYEKENKNESQVIKQNNNGGASDWYLLPKDANTLQDLIEHRNMNGSVKDIFKACYRLGIKTEDELRDLNKMAYYSLREIGRITGRKDYITIAKELMGSQAIEKDENEI